MINKILPFLNRILPTKLAYDALQKANPKLKKFAKYAGAAGYGANEVMDFLRNRFSPEEIDKSQDLRPDQIANSRLAKESNRLPNAIMDIAPYAAGALGGIAGNIASDYYENRGVRPSEITKMNPKPKQVGYNPRLGIEEKGMPPIPPDEEIIIPQASNEQLNKAKKVTALQKFAKHKKKSTIANEDIQRFKEGYGIDINEISEEDLKELKKRQQMQQLNELLNKIASI